jgi:ribosomal protein S27E
MSNSGASVNKYTCSGCGADLVFNPEKGVLKCEYCGAEQAIAQAGQQLQERSFEQYIKNSQTRLEKLSQTALEVTCDDCGANITFEPPQVAGSCPFCAAKIVAQPKIADPSIAPEGIIPFTIGRQQARQNLQKWLKSIWFAPGDLQKLAQAEKIQGVYLPFWTYDAQTTNRYRGERGDYYYVTETYTETNSEGKQETKTREVRHTRWSSASGVVHCTFDDLLVSATKLVNNDRLQALEPWHLQESLRPYEPSYLAGFEAQRAQVSLEEGFETAKSMMSSRIHSAVRSDIGGDEQRVNSVSTDYRNITFKHLLLPVWITSYRYQNKRYQVMINARTGEVQGDRPYSATKIILAILGGLAVVGVIILVIMLFASR